MRILSRLLLISGLFGTASMPAVAQVEGDDFELRGFSIYDTQAAKARARIADEHIESGRWAEALSALQRLIEDHRGEVLGPSRPERNSRVSKRVVHRGASDHARARLFTLNDEAKALYRDRYGARAAAALRAAIANNDRAALTQIARRWPITLEAQRAWWSLGDLELELGNVQNCLQSWQRALAYALAQPSRSFLTEDEWRAGRADYDLNDTDHEQRAGVEARIELALALGADPRRGDAHSDGTSQTLDRGAGWATALKPSRALGAPLGRNPDSWSKPTELPGHPFWRSRPYNLYPARWQDSIFISTTLEVLAIGAFTGVPLWRSGEALTGWDRLSSRAERDTFFEAVDTFDALIAPAVSQGVVVAALQIPYSMEQKINYGDMPIIKKIPTRRLFAFDAATGTKLWDTRPPLLWDGQTGSFSDRVRIVGPPVIEGSRVLVPTVMLAGRIEYHVGCFDLHTGDLLWSTVLITGQSELNMFGRQEEEFSAPPLTVTGNRVIALTQLGILAALDLFTGDVLWELVYDQVPLPANRHIRAPKRKAFWDNSPPIVTGDVVLATPHDGVDLMAVDVATGHLIWDLDHARVERMSAGADPRLLIGADSRTIYLAGRRVVALSTPGVGHAPPDRQRWAFPPGDSINRDMPRPVLTEDRIYIPASRSLFTVDRKTGRRLEETGWDDGEPGNLLIGDGMMFALQHRHLSGYFEWERLVTRARADLELTPDAVAKVLNLALLLEKRGVSEWQDGRTKAAHEHLRQARNVLEEFTQGSLEETHRSIRSQLHSILRGESRVLKDLADPQGALELLERARSLVATRTELRDTLVEELALLRGRDVERWLEVLAILDEECADLELICEAEWTEDTNQPWTGHLEPVVSSPARAGADPFALPVALWILVERSELLGTLGRSGEEFRDLHRMLAEHANDRIGNLSAAHFGARRIREKLLAGETQGYAMFEESAGALMQRALELGDVDLLQQVDALFPGSNAAHRANDTRLHWAVERLDAASVATIVLDGLPENFRLRTASERSLRHLLRMAYVFGEIGNTELRAALCARLAAAQPELYSDMAPVAGLQLSELTKRWTAPVAAPAAETTSTFDHRVRQVSAYRGRHTPVGEIERASEGSGAEHVLVFSSDNLLTAFSSETHGDVLWERYLDPEEVPGTWKHRFGTTAGRAHFATHESVVTLDRQDGTELWRWTAREGEIVSLGESDGILIISLDPDSGQRQQRWILALDASSGIPLWEQTIGHAYRQYPLCGDGRLVHLPQLSRSAGEVRDIFTGRRVSGFTVRYLNDSFARQAWIQDEKLIIPRLRQGQKPDRNHIFGIDLETGEEAWRVDFEHGHLGGTELQSVLHYQERAFMVLHSARSGGRRGALYELNANIGSISSTPIVELREDDTLLGMRTRNQGALPSPYLFLRSEPKIGDFYTLHAVHLPYGTRWDAQLPFQEEHAQILSSSDLALSQSTLVIYWPESRKGSSSRGTLLFFDRKSGRKLDDRVLSEQTGGNSALALQALGDCLFICGARQMEVLR
ncbi:MAG: outer membrane protein assembly factor BamB [Chlamydiales bacterium]|jgi:outer membrane protein assembly factor BamB